MEDGLLLLRLHGALLVRLHDPLLLQLHSCHGPHPCHQIPLQFKRQISLLLRLLPHLKLKRITKWGNDYVDRQTYEAERKRNNDLVTRIHGYDYLFDIVAQDFPALAAALRAQRPPTQAAEAQTEEPQDQTEEAATAQGTPQA
ncbi:predicted protein [Arabidopsis lyrata subsp. lyrata]|uniref:Predicted protein n=1 Tax=Arabidopsis lyrata subsp. lyrata TaxID=81972 RepID=D7KJ92_ARALL|nr:predicted protein [Arabidopsis lyrata subsp. lyrata]